MNICENSSSWERYVVDKSFSSSRTNKIRQVKTVRSCFLCCISGKAPMWPLTFKKNKGLSFMFMSESAFSLRVHPSKTWVLHSPTIEAFQLEKIQDCAHVVILCTYLLVGSPFKLMLRSGRASLRLLNDCENVRGRHEEQWGFWAFLMKNLLL